MLCILKKIKTGFQIQNYIPRTHETKNRILSKIKGACSSFFQKYINCTNIARSPKNIFFLSQIGGGATASPFCLRLLCLSYAIIYQEQHTSNLRHKFSVDSVYVACGRGSVLLWAGDVVICYVWYFRFYGFLRRAPWRRDATAATSLQCAYELTPLHCIGCLLPYYCE